MIMVLLECPKYSEEIRYLYFETVYSNSKLVIDGEFIKFDGFIYIICIQSQNGLIESNTYVEVV